MSWQQLCEWQRFDEIEPFGEARADLRAGIVAANIVNSSASRPRRPAKPSDFMPKFERQKSQQPITEDAFKAMKERARGFAQAK